VDEESFVFGSFRLIPSQRVLFEDGKQLRLGSRALDILVTLVESAGETIHKDQLIARTWPDTVVDEGALRVHVAALRKALTPSYPEIGDTQLFDYKVRVLDGRDGTAAGVRVLERVPCQPRISKISRTYMQTKKHKMGHLLEGL